MKILIAADGSKHTKDMLAYLGTHAWLTESNQYTVLTVVPEVPRRAASYVDADVVKGYYQEEADKVLEPVRAFFAQQGVPAEFQHKVGHPAEAIAHEATQGNYDLLALGSHGHGVLGNLILGSVATKVLSLCKVPVLLLR
ncbi:universal stress protein [Pseudorhodoferax sp. Leaf267]|uniref:universal stress protein n=1 Tax=Pseudorhodoferax sp. Leaf267 TaxID=1736316 RepID=UPI00070046AB|nr:universal stress protein [Pseudorhodoferax sp. Leaf267]KQP12749.1 universal stress protein UspA [Pseudorhodoferax sp. Leaf267]